MLVIKKRFLQPITYLYTAVGVSVFSLTFGTLVALNPKFETDRSAATTSNSQPIAVKASESRAVVMTQDEQSAADSSSAKPTQSNETSQGTQAASQQTTPSSQSTPQPENTPASSQPQDSTPVETTEPVAEPAPETPAPTNPPATEQTEEQSPSLLGGLLQGVGNLLDAVI